MKFEDGQKWRTRGGDVVSLSGSGNWFKSHNPRTGDEWAYGNDPKTGEASEYYRQTFTYPSTEDLVELVSE